MRRKIFLCKQQLDGARRGGIPREIGDERVSIDMHDAVAQWSVKGGVVAVAMVRPVGVQQSLDVFDNLPCAVAKGPNGEIQPMDDRPVFHSCKREHGPALRRLCVDEGRDAAHRSGRDSYCSWSRGEK